MGGWFLLACGVTCFWGAVVFLTFAAAETDATERALQAYEDQERKARKKRRAAHAEDEELTVETVPA